MPVAVQIAGGEPARRTGLLKREAGLAGVVGKSSVSEIPVEERLLVVAVAHGGAVHLGADMAVGHQNIRAAVFVGWGCGFFDFDNDSWKDLLLVNGHVFPEVERLKSDIRYRDRAILYRNLGGKFLDVSEQAGPGILERHAARGAAFGDLDNDGAIEVVINNIDDTPSLLVNRGEKKNWLRVKTRGTKSNHDGIGARVTVVAGALRMTDEVRSGASFISHSDLRLHYGLGDAKRADEIRVRWPSGMAEVFPGVEANREVLLEEGKGKPVASQPGAAKKDRL